MPAKEECNKATSQEHPFKLRIFDVIFIQNQQRESEKFVIPIKSLSFRIKTKENQKENVQEFLQKINKHYL